MVIGPSRVTEIVVGDNTNHGVKVSKGKDVFTFHYRESEAYNYGIKLVTVDQGFTKIINDSSMMIYHAENNLTASVLVSWDL
jgi:hypothetical protein